jgi:hypothetical protein
MSLVEDTGFQRRERKLDALRFIRTMIVSASGERGGRQAEVMQDYFYGRLRRSRAAASTAGSERQWRR